MSLLSDWNFITFGTFGKLNSSPNIGNVDPSKEFLRSFREPFPIFGLKMTNQQINIQTPIVQKTLWSRKLLAFTVVALASFLLLSLAWPLSVRSYVSHGVIEVDVIKTPVATGWFKQQLARIVQSHTSDEQVFQLAQEAHSAIPGRALAELASDSDFPSRFGVRLAKGHEEGIFRLNVSYRGKGTKAENYMVNLLSSNIARDFLTSPHVQLGTGKILSPAESSTSNNSQTTDLIAQSEQLNQQAHEILARLESGSSQNGGSRFNRTNASPFMNVAHSSALPVSTENEIAELKQTVESLSGLVQETAANGNEVAFSVRGVSALPSTPVRGVPKFPQILLLSAISGFLATVVTIAYRPFENKGFENVASVVHKLGIPVVATLGDVSEDGPNYSSSSGQVPWANRVVSFAELILFAVTIIAIGFCLVNPEIRSAFADNLFHGFARIAWMFQN